MADNFVGEVDFAIQCIQIHLDVGWPGGTSWPVIEEFLIYEMAKSWWRLKGKVTKGIIPPEKLLIIALLTADSGSTNYQMTMKACVKEYENKHRMIKSRFNYEDKEMKDLQWAFSNTLKHVLK